jgi:RNA polymerase sigma factor (sigma-70 family)
MGEEVRYLIFNFSLIEWDSEEGNQIANSENFEELLLWLDPDPDQIGIPDRNRGALKYEAIRRRIIRIYQNRGCLDAEEIADETFERVCKKVKELRKTYMGDPALYFFGVAKNVYRERINPRPLPMLVPPLPEDEAEEIERRMACLDECLKELSPEKRELILNFNEGEKRERIEGRKRLAAQLGIDTKALSLRALRIRRELLVCIKECLGLSDPEK